MYRPPNGDMTVFERFCENLVHVNDKISKKIIFAGDLNIKVLDYNSNKNIQHFFSKIFQIISYLLKKANSRNKKHSHSYRSDYYKHYKKWH